jgi:hypothetical protein
MKTFLRSGLFSILARHSRAGAIILAALSAMAIPTITNAQLLTEVRVEFVVPQCDDRDHDTRTSITIKKGDLVIASEDNVAPGMHLPDPGHYGPFYLPVRHTITKSEYYGSRTIMEDFPNVHDTWITQVVVIAKFADNTELRTVSELLTMRNQDRKEFQN